MKTIVLDGQEYELVPVIKNYKPIVPKQAEKIIEAYTQEKNGQGSIQPVAPQNIKVAQPKLSEYRERYKKHDIRLSDVVPPRNFLKQVPRQDHQLDNFSYKGEKLFFGTGVEVEAG